MTDDGLKIIDIQKIMLNQSLKREEYRIRSMSPVEFERYVADIFIGLGYDVELTPPTNDGGKDIIIRKNGKSYYVECKHFSDATVGREIIQKAYGAARFDDQDGCFIVTSSYFNQNALDIADKKDDIFLIDFYGLMRLWESRNSFDAKTKIDTSAVKYNEWYQQFSSCELSGVNISQYVCGPQNIKCVGLLKNQVKYIGFNIFQITENDRFNYRRKEVLRSFLVKLDDMEAFLNTLINHKDMQTKLLGEIPYYIFTDYARKISKFSREIGFD